VWETILKSCKKVNAAGQWNLRHPVEIEFYMYRMHIQAPKVFLKFLINIEVMEEKLKSRKKVE
jgi:hypothetical protein